ncbi:hypothetical protein SDC9_20915 [bioreactor metagenome]|uniref:Tryptophan transport protein n=1 Tax=bioreactor metagenome TaxID=1076179 RepID=A0A644U821_9ZZZZ|nr:ABC transporter [Negativicutes bacterium]
MELKKPDLEMTVYETKKGGQYRWVTITTLLLAIGAILHLISPSIAGVTPNWTIAMYCLAINLTKPTRGQAFGIGLVAAAINIPTSKAAFPYGNLVSEPVGALVCAIIVSLSLKMTIGNLNLKPAISTFLTTLVSGMIFVTILKVVMSLPLSVYLYGMIPFVFGVGVLNAAITQILYFPAQKLFNLQGGSHDSNNN